MSKFSKPNIARYIATCEQSLIFFTFQNNVLACFCRKRSRHSCAYHHAFVVDTSLHSGDLKAVGGVAQSQAVLTTSMTDGTLLREVDYLTSIIEFQVFIQGCD